MLVQKEIDVVVVDEATDTAYQFIRATDIMQALDITPGELAFAMCMPDGTLINDRYVFNKNYIGGLEKLSKDMVVIDSNGTGIIVPNARVAAAITGYDIGSIAYALDTDGKLDLPVKFISLDSFIKDMANSFDRQLSELKPQPNLTIRPDKTKVSKMLDHLEKALDHLDNLEKLETVSLPTQPIGKTNEIDPGEYVLVDNSEYAENLSNGPAQNFVQESLSNLKLIDLTTGKKVFFNSYAQMANYFKTKGKHFSEEQLKNMRKNKTIVDGYLIRMAKDDSPLPNLF